VWWDGKCDRLNDAKLAAFREFRGNGTSHNYENYLISERILRSTCRDKKIEYWRSIADVWWGAHPRCVLLLYKGLIGSIVDYAWVCYSGMAKTHMFRLERVQYRGIPPLLQCFIG
jgi:hypothetical protein